MSQSMRREVKRYYRHDSRVKVVLLDVSNDFTDSVGESSYNMIHPPLGLMTLSSYLRGVFSPEECSVSVVDVAVEGGWDRMMAILEESCPDVVGLRALSHTHLQFHEAARRIKAWNPEVLLIGGGPYANASPGLIMEDESFDAVCVAEGEYVLRDLVKALLAGGRHADLSGVNGLHYRSPVDGAVHQTPPMMQVEDLNTLPYSDYGEIDLDVYAGKHAHTCILRPYAVLMTSRGCPFKCVYCHVLFGKNFRYRSAENVAGEFLALYREHGVRDFFITDDIFNIHLKHAKEVLRAIIALDIGQRIYFPNGLRGDIIDDEFLDLMKAANVVEVVYAIEAASPRIQKMIKKNLRMARVERAIVETARRGIIVNAFFMIGFPGETEEEVMMTKDLILRLLEYLHFPYISVARAYHGSALYQMALDMGYEEEFLLKHALTGQGTLELQEETNFLPNAVLRRVRLEVSKAFIQPDRMNAVLPIQAAKLTRQELLRKYAGYFSTEPERITSLMDRFSSWRALSGSGAGYCARAP